MVPTRLAPRGAPAATRVGHHAAARRSADRTRGGLRTAGVVAVLLAGCAMLRPAELEVLSGQHVVLGKVDVAQLDASVIIVDVVRVDGGFALQFYVGRGPAEFALALPPGRYLIPSIRIAEQRITLPDQPTRPISVTFDVGDEPAVYIGTLRLATTVGTRVDAAVIDEYAPTVAALRRLYSNIPTAVSRALMRAT